MSADVLIENDQFVCCLRSAIGDGASGLSHVPALLKRVLAEDRWRERKIKSGVSVRFDRFEAFVATPPLEGLGADMGLIRRIVASDPEAVDLLDRAVQRESGRPESVDNVNDIEDRPTGNSEATALRRLRKDRPDLHGRVISGELSAHAAMVDAGFRRRTITVPLDPESAFESLRRHFSSEQWDQFVRLIETFRSQEGRT